MRAAMIKKSWLKSNSMVVPIVGAVVILVLIMLFPMSTSLGQGINEGIVNGFEGVYDPGDQLYNLRFLYQGGAYVDVPMNKLPAADFTNHSQQGQWTTSLNYLPALQAGYQRDPNQVRAELGTRNNVATFANPWPGKPIGYTVQFLKGLSAQNINPMQFGGPNIPPGSVPYSKLSGGVLQIDTASNGNTIIQTKTGMVPEVLQSLVPTLK